MDPDDDDPGPAEFFGDGADYPDVDDGEEVEDANSDCLDADGCHFTKPPPEGFEVICFTCGGFATFHAFAYRCEVHCKHCWVKHCFQTTFMQENHVELVPLASWPLSSWGAIAGDALSRLPMNIMHHKLPLQGGPLWSQEEVRQAHAAEALEALIRAGVPASARQPRNRRSRHRKPPSGPVSSPAVSPDARTTQNISSNKQIACAPAPGGDAVRPDALPAQPHSEESVACEVQRVSARPPTQRRGGKRG